MGSVGWSVAWQITLETRGSVAGTLDTQHMTCARGWALATCGATCKKEGVAVLILTHNHQRLLSDLSDRKGRNGTYGNPVWAPTAKQEREKRRRAREI